MATADDTFSFRAIALNLAGDAWHCIRLPRAGEKYPRTGLPTLVALTELEEAAAAGQLRVAEADIDLARRRFHMDLEAHEVDNINKRWTIVQRVRQDEHRWLDANDRPDYIAELKAEGYKEPTVRLVMTLYYLFGCCKEALQPQFSNCGAPNTKRRKHKLLDIASANTPASMAADGDDFLTATDYDVMDLCIDDCVLTSSRNKLTTKRAYRAMLLTYYTILVGDPLGARELVTISIRGPSLGQFKRRVRERRRNQSRDEQVGIFGEKQFNQKHRERFRSANRGTAGPGDTFEMDAWQVSELILVSETDRTIQIGSPWVYFFVDRCTGAIAGVSGSFQAPCYDSALAALLAMAMPKSELCKRWGLTIRDEDWPIFMWPSRLVCDRGEMRGLKVDAWPSLLGIDIANLGPRRPELKPYVEGILSHMLREVVQGLPGSSTVGERDRGVVAGKPRMTLRAFLAVLALGCLRYNAAIVPEKSVPSVLRAAGITERRRIKLFVEGERFFGPVRRVVDEEQIRLTLMPHKDCDVTEDGISLNGLHYTNEFARERGWFLRGTGGAPRRVKAVYDPSDVAYAWLIHPNGTQTLSLTLTEPCDQYAGVSVAEFRIYQKEIAKRRVPQVKAVLLDDVITEAAIAQVVATETAATRAAQRALPAPAVEVPTKALPQRPTTTPDVLEGALRDEVLAALRAGTEFEESNADLQ